MGETSDDKIKTSELSYNSCSIQLYVSVGKEVLEKKINAIP